MILFYGRMMAPEREITYIKPRKKFWGYNCGNN
jgi:hypothetical protein